jgi:hypothetical protein
VLGFVLRICICICIDIGICVGKLVPYPSDGFIAVRYHEVDIVFVPLVIMIVIIIIIIIIKVVAVTVTVMSAAVRVIVIMLVNGAMFVAREEARKSCVAIDTNINTNVNVGPQTNHHIKMATPKEPSGNNKCHNKP